MKKVLPLLIAAAFASPAVLAHQDWAMRTSWRRLSYGIDTLLLTAGITLWSLLGLNPVGNSPWLGTKLVLLLVYIVLGSVALKRGRSDGASASMPSHSAAVAGLTSGATDFSGGGGSIIGPTCW